MQMIVWPVQDPRSAVELKKIEYGSVKLAISAPRDVTILRKEVFDRVKEENKEAISGDLDILRLLK